MRNTRYDDFYFNTQFDKTENQVFRKETQKSKILKITLKQLEDLQKFINNDNFSYTEFSNKLNNIEFGLWDYKFFNSFFRLQKELLTETSINKYKVSLIKNLLNNNLNTVIQRVNIEIDNLEIWKIID